MDKDYTVGVSLMKAYRAKRKALEIIECNLASQYERLWGYAEEVRRTNPSSTIQIKCKNGEIDQARPKFMRL